MSSLKEFLNHKVRVITTDARVFEGKLEGFDNATNIVISGCEELIIASDEDEEFTKFDLGVYMLRGGNVVCIGLVEGETDWKGVRGDKLKGTKNPL